MVTRERVHDLGVFKAVGMTPRQTIVMVVCWVVGPALAAAVIAVPVAALTRSRCMPLDRWKAPGCPSPS
jgi:putative ABC transport system permease protein